MTGNFLARNHIATCADAQDDDPRLHLRADILLTR
jgi:hypothetical protein